MTDLFWQLIGLLLLLTGIAIGYWRSVKPYQGRLSLWALGLVTLIMITGIGGLLGSPFWWLDAPQSFSWDLPPLAARLLASASISFAVGCYLCLQYPTFRRARLILLLTAIYLMPLVVAVLFFHLNRFDFFVPLTYGFFILAVGIGLATTLYLFRQPTIIPDSPLDTAPVNPLTNIWIILTGLLLALWGIALFLTDSGPSPHIWVWPGDLLTSRLIAVMLLALAVTAFYARTYRDTARLFLSIVIVYGLGVVAANLWNPAAIKVLYVAVFAALFIISALLLLTDRKTAT
jgi:hypothetical protein